MNKKIDARYVMYKISSAIEDVIFIWMPNILAFIAGGACCHFANKIIMFLISR